MRLTDDRRLRKPQAETPRHISRGAPGTMTQTFSYDATDLNIVEQLRLNGRANNQQIAEKLGLTATTVSTRIKRMEDANQLRVVAVSDFSAHGFNVLLRIPVEVDGRPASEVAAELAELPEVVATHLVTGRYDIDMLVALHDFDDLSDFLLNDLSGIRGIRSLSPAVVVDIIKYKFDVAPIEARTTGKGA
ncbi:MAG: Lrp/AsnC family transcriptional regulator [Novosphingobium meiothermophilum]